MNKEVLDKIIPTLSEDDIEQLLFSHISALEIIENRTNQDIENEYGLIFLGEGEPNEVVTRKQIEGIYRINEKIMKDR